MNAAAIVDRLLEAYPDDPSVYLKRYHRKRDAIIEWCHFFYPKVVWSCSPSEITLLNQPLNNGMTRKLVDKLIADKLISPAQCHWYPNEVRCDIFFDEGELQDLVVADPE